MTSQYCAGILARGGDKRRIRHRHLNGALGYYLYKRGLLPGRNGIRQGHGMGNPSTIYVRVEQGKVLVGGKAAVAGAGNGPMTALPASGLFEVFPDYVLNTENG